MTARRMLVLSPHPDDETLGAGGAIARFAKAGGEVTVLTLSAHMPPLFPEELHQRTIREARAAHAALGVKESIFLDHPAISLRQLPSPRINGEVLDVVRRVRPHVLLLPFVDRNEDHRVVFEAGMVAQRPTAGATELSIVAAYETLSSTNWNAAHVEPSFTPNWFVNITDFVDIKLRAMACYESQLKPFPHPRSLEVLKALAVVRGSAAGVAYAEAYHMLRMTAGAEELGAAAARGR